MRRAGFRFSRLVAPFWSERDVVALVILAILLLSVLAVTP
jgi:hypothetical protein